MVEHHLKGVKKQKMKHSIDNTTETVISLVTSRVNEGKSFMLFRVRINGARKSIIYVSDGEEGNEDFCTVNMSCEASERLFERICECGASPEHLADILDDACRERYL